MRNILIEDGLTTTATDTRGMEFDGEKWVPKHPENGIDEIPDRKGHEFVSGEWVEKSMSAESDLVGGNLHAELKIFVRLHQLGTVYGPECGYQFFSQDPKRVRKPDVSFVRKGRLPEDKPPRGNIRVPPDFAAEVVSPTDRAEEVFDKLDQYLADGVLLVWAIFPLTRCVWVLRPNGSDTRIKQGSISGEEVVPGFSIPIETLFADI